MSFTLHTTDKDCAARAGTLTTAHSIIETPIFMPVGTAGTVKAVHQRELENDINAPIILGNTYHLYLRPGLNVLRDAGGLHQFIGWNRSILTDSGGYQVYSLSHRRKLKEEGVTFQSHIDGSSHLFSPESVIETQRTIGADIMMAFDECTPYPCEKSYAKKSLGFTHRWLERCFNHYEKINPHYGFHQSLFPIVQGSTYPDLRVQSAEEVSKYNADGYAIGGLSVGEPAENMYEISKLVCDHLPSDKPRYLMGVGTPANILECIACGVDMFDCVMPTRNARNGMLFTSEGIINIRNEKWKDDFSPLDENGVCFVDQNYTKAYLRHLVISGEILASQIATLHNLTFYLWLVREARKHIMQGDFLKWKNEIVVKLAARL
ncbi:MAG: tRNA guanosine(34) transglycosylase Tgt [Bacteroidota bacterium]